MKVNAYLSAIIQEIIDSASCASGGNMTLLFDIVTSPVLDDQGNALLHGPEAETWSAEGDEAGDNINVGEESASLVIEYR